VAYTAHDKGGREDSLFGEGEKERLPSLKEARRLPMDERKEKKKA